MAFISTMILSLVPRQSHHLSTIIRFWSPPVNSGRPASHHSSPVLHRLGSERGGRRDFQSCDTALTDIHAASHVISFCRHQSKFIQLELAGATSGLGMRHFAWRFEVCVCTRVCVQDVMVVLVNVLVGVLRRCLGQQNEVKVLLYQVIDLWFGGHVNLTGKKLSMLAFISPLPLPLPPPPLPHRVCLKCLSEIPSWLSRLSRSCVATLKSSTRKIQISFHQWSYLSVCQWPEKEWLRTSPWLISWSASNSVSLCEAQSSISPTTPLPA